MVELKNKPLIEAIFELRWALSSEQPPGLQTDPNYSILPGLLWDKIRSDYPERELLPTAQIPEPLAAYQVQHRFRVGPEKWPIAQLGPGILSVNQTEGYVWPEFGQQATKVVEALCDSYPGSDALQASELSLRYIDAHEFDFRAGNVLEFLKDSLHARLELTKTLFQGSNIGPNPSSFDWTIAFSVDIPPGLVSLRLATGFKNGSTPVVVSEIKVVSDATQVPAIPSGFEEWVTKAHDVAHDWFFKLIAGKLKKRYEGLET